MLTLDEAEVERRLAAIDLVGLMRETLIAHAQGDARAPTRAALALPGPAWFAAMPAWVRLPREALGAKLVVAMPGNAERGLPTHRAVVVLLDPHTGAPSAWIEAEALTRERTAAVSVAATHALARRPRGVHAIVGAGAQGTAHAAAFARAGLAESVRVWSRKEAHAEALVRMLKDRGTDARRCASPAETVRAADVITTATASAVPLFDDDAVADGAHVNAVGACTADRRELGGALVGTASLAVEDDAAAHAEAGDIVLAVAEGRARWDGIVTLGDVFAGRASPRPGRCSIYVSLGLGVEDVAAAAAICV